MSGLPSVVIFTEAGEGIGYGHLSRMQALCDAFEHLYSIRPTLMVGSLARPLVLEDIGAKGEIVIVDSYLAPLEFYERVSANAKLAVFIDDFDRLEYPSGLVTRPKILRKPFWQVRPFVVKDEISSILITIGGLDTHNTMPKLIKTAKIKYPKAKIKAVISQNFTNLDDIQALNDERVELVSSLDASAMQELMSGSDMAISSGGQTLCELCACGVPTLVIQMADNQKANIADFVALNAVLYVCDVTDVLLEQKLDMALRALCDKAYRQGLSHQTTQSNHANGAIELATKLTEAVCHK